MTNACCDITWGLLLSLVFVQVVSGPHKGEGLSLAVGAAEVRVGRNAPKKNGLRLDHDFEVSDKCVTLQYRQQKRFLIAYNSRAYYHMVLY